MVVAVVVLPLFCPPVIFGAGAVEAFTTGLDWRTGLLLLCAYSLAAAQHSAPSPWRRRAGTRWSEGLSVLSNPSPSMGEGQEVGVDSPAV